MNIISRIKMLMVFVIVVNQVYHTQLQVLRPSPGRKSFYYRRGTHVYINNTVAHICITCIFYDYLIFPARGHTSHLKPQDTHSHHLSRVHRLYVRVSRVHATQYTPCACICIYIYFYYPNDKAYLSVPLREPSVPAFWMIG